MTLKTPAASYSRLALPVGVSGSESSTLPIGSLAFASDTDQLRLKKSTGWADVSGGGGSPTGAAGGDLGSTYPNPTVTALHETSGPTKLTLGAIADGKFLLRSGSTLIGGYPVSNQGTIPLWATPAQLGQSPGTIDNEFDGTASTWLYWDGTNGAARIPSGTPDMFSTLTPTTAVPKLTINTQSKSWARIQPPSGTFGYWYYPSIQTPTLPVWYWFRSGGMLNEQGKGGMSCGLSLAPDSSGHPDTANHVRCGYAYNVNGNGVLVPGGVSRAANVETLLGSGSIDAAASSFSTWEYFAIYKTSTTVYYFGFNEARMWKCFGITAHVTTTFWVGFWVRNADTTNDVWTVHEMDFVRQLQGSTPPWVR